MEVLPAIADFAGGEAMDADLIRVCRQYYTGGNILNSVFSINSQNDI